MIYLTVFTLHNTLLVIYLAVFTLHKTFWWSIWQILRYKRHFWWSIWQLFHYFIYFWCCIWQLLHCVIYFWWYRFMACHYNCATVEAVLIKAPSALGFVSIQICWSPLGYPTRPLRKATLCWWWTPTRRSKLYRTWTMESGPTKCERCTPIVFSQLAFIVSGTSPAIQLTFYQFDSIFSWGTVA